MDYRNLPEAVVERLAKADPTVMRAVQASQGGRVFEARARVVETRANDDGTVGMAGYASVFETPYDVAGGAPYGWAETMARGCCDKSVSERDDVRLLLNHDGLPLARTKSGTMTLAADQVGLRVDVPSLDLTSPLVQTIRSAMERGDMDEMSFAFQVLRQEWNADYTERRILEVKLFDVSVVTYPANPAAVAQLRTVAPVAEERMSVSLAAAIADQYRRKAS